MSLWSRLERRLGDLASELVLDEYRDQLNQARQLLAKGDIAAAIDSLEALLSVKPDHGQALIVLGEARLANHEPQKAQDAFERALKLRGQDPAALLGNGLALVAQGLYETAITPLARAIAEAGGDRGILADAYRGLGIAWRRRGDLDKAIRELRKAVVEDGEDIDARAALGEALVADGGPHDEALRHLERAAVAENPPALALYGLGRLALVDGTPAVAGEHLAKSRSLVETDATPFGKELRTEILVAQGDAALAERDAMRAHGFYLEALQLEPRRAELHAKVAAAHRTIGNLDAALTSYDRALSLDGHAGLELLRAAVDTAIAAHDTTRAAPWANDLLGKDPSDVRAIVARGLAMVSTQPDAARALLELAAARDDVDAHVLLAGLSLQADPQAAARSALAALRTTPHHGKAREILAQARAAELPEPSSSEIGETAAFLERVVESRRELGHFVGETARAAANLDQPLLVTVMGEFSSGKSTFVNAFIGADVAPTGITPTTATINVVRYGRERGGRIIRLDGTTLELGWDALMEHLRALTPDDARKIDRVEILVPLPQLEKINIVDTPGLNSIQPEHEATARAFIARADAVVWVFTASQGGKASEKKALQSIRDEGKRVLGVLNKADQLSDSEVTEVVEFIGGSLGELVETIVPVSARHALEHKRAPKGSDGNWPALATALEERFFQQARQLKRDACARTLRGIVAEAQAVVAKSRHRAVDAADAARAARDELAASAAQFAGEGVVVERKALSEQMALLYRRASREVLDLVRPRRLPFSSHTATSADRDYLIALLASGFETAIESGRRRVATELTSRSRTAEQAARALEVALGFDVVGDLERVAADRIGLAMSRVFDRARAYLRGYLEGGYVEAFFRNDVPRLELAEDAIYHALYRSAPDLDREVGDPLARAATDALTALALRLDHWRAVVDVRMFDVEVSVVRALEIVGSRL
ncbi:MAG: tetratricopeptide repeat protein [Kofleriaceae bacterium]|nr:tetratricopeptide repeat protein [Kofleriaceae bacterium]